VQDRSQPRVPAPQPLVLQPITDKAKRTVRLELRKLSQLRRSFLFGQPSLANAR
jgi:hypothetical protein